MKYLKAWHRLQIHSKDGTKVALVYRLKRSWYLFNARLWIGEGK